MKSAIRRCVVALGCATLMIPLVSAAEQPGKVTSSYAPVDIPRTSRA